MTHQDIIDRMEALGVEHSEAYRKERARIDKERESLQELCGGLGHTFAKSRDRFESFAGVRCCLFCHKKEA